MASGFSLTVAVKPGGELVLHREGDTTPVREEREMRSLLVTALDKALDNLARKALLRA